MIRLLYVFILACVVLVSNVHAQWNTYYWEKVTLPTGFNSTTYLDVFFLPSNPQYGWICGFDGRVLRTTNGGTTWIGSVLPRGGQYESIRFVNERVGYVSGADRNEQGSIDINLGGIFRTTDGGSTWTDISPVVRDIGGTIRRARVWGNFFINETTGILIGGGCGDEPQTFFRTTDGGRTWQLATYTVANTGLSHVIMYDAEGLCYASSSGRIWRSNNGGRSWNVVSSSGSEIWQENLSIAGQSFLVATAGTECIGGGGTVGDIRFSTNGAVSFNRFQTRNQMFGTHLINADTGWAVGIGREVYRTSNAGRTWSAYRCGLDDDANLDDVWFINDTTGWIVGNGVYRTSSVNPFTTRIVAQGGKFALCDSTPIVLSVVPQGEQYRWNTGATTSTITVRQPGAYSVTVTSRDGCVYTTPPQTVISTPSPKPQVTIQGDSVVCAGTTVVLEIDSGWKSYRWNNGATTRALSVTQSGTYTATVTDTTGCEGSISKKITVLPLPVFSIQSNTKRFHICYQESITLSTTPTFASTQWSTGETAQQITVTEAGTYRAIVTDTNNCQNVITVEVTGGKEIIPAIAQNRNARFCDGDTLILSAQDGYSSYQWSTGDTVKTITVTSSQNITLTVTDQFGCVGKTQLQTTVDPNPIFIVGLPGSREYVLDSTLAASVKCSTFVVQNTSTQDLILSTSQLSRNVEFSVPQAQLPLRIPVGESRNLTLCYMPSQLQEQRDTLLISNNYCSRYMFVRSAGVAQHFTAITECVVPLTAVTTAIQTPGMYLFPAYPQPAETFFAVPLVFTAPVATIAEPQATLHDVFGTQLCTASWKPQSQSTTNNTTVCVGEMRIEVGTLASGSYILKIRAGEYTATQQISICK